MNSKKHWVFCCTYQVCDQHKDTGWPMRSDKLIRFKSNDVKWSNKSVALRKLTIFGVFHTLYASEQINNNRYFISTYDICVCLWIHISSILLVCNPQLSFQNMYIKCNTSLVLYFFRFGIRWQNDSVVICETIQLWFAFYLAKVVALFVWFWSWSRTFSLFIPNKSQSWNV